MSFWTAIVVIVAIGVGSEMYKYRIRHSTRSSKDDRQLNLLSQRLDALETRISNLETLILEQEKMKQFDDLTG